VARRGGGVGKMAGEGGEGAEGEGIEGAREEAGGEREDGVVAWRSGFKGELGLEVVEEGAGRVFVLDCGEERGEETGEGCGD